jgi:antitoxin component YwqK of YwqJK toxin-antitoxin module
MKIHLIKYLAFASLLFALIGCQSKRLCDDVICQTYVHRYGVPLDPDEWSARGRHGRVVSTRRDGVVVSNSYESGVLHGETTYTFPHREVIQKRETYCQGELEKEIWNYHNGIPQRQVTYEEPHRHTAIAWYENGVPQCKEEYQKGRLAQGEYYNLSNETESRIDDCAGIRMQRDGYGNLTSIDEIHDGQMVLRTTYHPNGTPEALTPYVNDEVHGQRRTFTIGGEPATIEEWRGSRQHGNTIVFENGEKCSDLPYVNGQPHGIEQRYREGQILAQRNTWVKGEKHGPCHTYVRDISQTDWYFQGKLVNKPTFDAMSNQ